MVAKNDMELAYKNWKKWQLVFEHQGEASENPLLAKANLFKEFMAEYSVSRTIRAGQHDLFREMLGSDQVNLAVKLNDESGCGLDMLDDELRSDFGTIGGKRGLRSVLSKVMAFLAPHSFVAWDQYARIGLNIKLGYSKSYVPSTYAEYLAGVNLLLKGDMREQLVKIAQGNYPTTYSSQNERFHRRVLDVHLMRIGGRWK